MAIDLRGLLAGAGISLTKETPKELWARCPNHFGGTKIDRRPSWSISKITLRHHCFSCMYGGSLTELLTDLTGSAPVDLEQQIMEQSFHRTLAETKRKPEDLLDEVLPTILTEWTVMNVLKDVPDRLLNSRYLLRPAVDHHQVRWNGDTKQWVMPLRTVAGDLCGAQYRQKGAVFTLPEGLIKSQLLFGYQQAIPFNYCAVVESPLDACRLYQIGIPAVSPLGAFASVDQARMLARNFDYVCLALDNDKAGHQGAEILTAMLRKQGTPSIMWDYSGLTDDEDQPIKDIGDCPSDDALLCAWDRTRRFGL